MKKVALIIILVIGIIWLAKFFYYQDILPRYATANIPAAWKTITLAKERSSEREMLGMPAMETDSTDTWNNGTASTFYTLQITYNNASVSHKSTIHYHVKNGKNEMIYLLKYQ